MNVPLLVKDIDPIALSVLCLAKFHRDSGTWAKKPESYWFAALVEGIGELGSALNGEHEHRGEL